MQLDFSKLTSLQYWLDPGPPYQFAAASALIFLFGTVTLLAIFLPLIRWQPWQVAMKRRLTAPLWTLGLTGLAFIFFRNQSIPYLGNRLLFVLCMLVLSAWIGYSLVVSRREVREEKLVFDRRQRFERYLPRKKG